MSLREHRGVYQLAFRDSLGVRFADRGGVSVPHRIGSLTTFSAALNAVLRLGIEKIHRGLRNTMDAVIAMEEEVNEEMLSRRCQIIIPREDVVIALANRVC